MSDGLDAPRENPVSERDAASAPDGDSVEDLSPADRVELGVRLLAGIETASLDLSAIMDRIETVSALPRMQNRILSAARSRGAIRDSDESDAEPRPTPEVSVLSVDDAAVQRREGSFTCRRCGASLSVGHFIDLDLADHGPFGPTCVRILLGEEDGGDE